MRRCLAAFLRILPLVGALGCARDGRTPVYVYSPHGRDQLQLLERAFEAERPELDVRWLDMGSQEILDRIRFEKVNPRCDVWFGGPTTTFDRGVAENLLAPHRPAFAASVGPRGIGPRDLYWPVYRTPAVIAWNSEAVRPEDAPKDWDDLLDPRWKGLVVIRDPMASGTMRAIWGHLVAREIRRTGRADAGMEWLRRLDAQTRTYALNPSLLVEKLARRDGLVTLWDLPDILIAREQRRPFDYAFPASGTVVIDDAVALVRGARNEAAAKAFIDFVGSVPAQLLAAERAHRLPARRDLPADRVPAWVLDVDRRMTAADVDWPLLARETSGWMAEWDRRVRGSGRRGG